MHLNRKIQPLPQLELEQMQKAGVILEELPTAPASSEVFRVFQWKYRIDSCEPWWRRWYFRLIWLPFARFSYLRMGMVPFERLEPDGSVSWKEDQGYFTEEWQAAQKAAQYEFGGYNAVALNACEMSRSCAPRVRFPRSTAERKYLRHGKRKVELDVGPVERLQQVLLDTQHLVDNYRQSRP